MGDHIIDTNPSQYAYWSTNFRRSIPTIIDLKFEIKIHKFSDSDFEKKVANFVRIK